MKHLHYNPDSQSSEEVTTEVGGYKYWRIAVPMPWIIIKWFRKKYICVCEKELSSHAEYELHYRKAAYEEKEIHGVGSEAN